MSDLSDHEVSGLVYRLERPSTNQPTNALILISPPETAYTFSLKAKDITSEYEQDEFYPFKSRIPLSVVKPGTYQLTLNVAQSDGTTYLQDTLTWEYDLEKPGLANAGFLNPGTNSDRAELVVASDRGPSVTELWIEGDLAESEKPKGSWRPIPSNSKIPLRLSAGDGSKAVQIKYRNRYGSEGPTAVASIRRKSVPPKNCKVIPVSLTTRFAETRLFLSADNDGPLFYDIWGDINPSVRNETFVQETDRLIHLRPDASENHVTVLVRDIAGNYCPRTDLAFHQDPDYLPSYVKIEGDPLWTDDPRVRIQLKYDHVLGKPVEVFISGGVEKTANTYAWIPMVDTLEVELAAQDGHRVIYAQFREGVGKESPLHYAGTYLRPSLSLSGLKSPYTLLLSHIVRATSVTIEGCEEIYNRVPYASNLPCTPRQSLITASYHLEDGTTVSRATTPRP